MHIQGDTNRGWVVLRLPSRKLDYVERIDNRGNFFFLNFNICVEYEITGYNNNGLCCDNRDFFIFGRIR